MCEPSPRPWLKHAHPRPKKSREKIEEGARHFDRHLRAGINDPWSSAVPPSCPSFSPYRCFNSDGMPPPWLKHRRPRLLLSKMLVHLLEYTVALLCGVSPLS